MNLLKKNRETHRLRKGTLWLLGWGWGCGGIVRDLGKVMCTLLYLEWKTNRDLLHGT